MRLPSRLMFAALCVGVGLFGAASTDAAADEPIRINPGFAQQLHQFRFHAVFGRITAWAPASRHQGTSSLRSGAREETLSIAVNEGGPKIDYALVTPREEFVIEIAESGDVRLARAPRSSSDVVPREFRQNAEGVARFSMGDDGAGAARTEPTLWHLLLAEPADRREKLVETLGVLRPSWPLLAQAEELEAALFQLASEQRRQPFDEWRAWVDDLASSRYSERLAAERRLREAGPQALPFLESIDPAGLDAEQRFRLRRIVDSLVQIGEEDTPERIATWMLSDARVWRLLLERDDAARRGAAREQLNRLLGEEIEFDPNAAADRRAQQIAQLEQRWAALRPPKLVE